VKLDYGGDIRRVWLEDLSGSDASFMRLKEELGRMYSVGLDAFDVRYRDDEGDLVRITGDAELAEAKQLLTSPDGRPTVFRLILVSLESPATGMAGFSGTRDEATANPTEVEAARSDWNPSGHETRRWVPSPIPVRQPSVGTHSRPTCCPPLSSDGLNPSQHPSPPHHPPGPSHHYSHPMYSPPPPPPPPLSHHHFPSQPTHVPPPPPMWGSRTESFPGGFPGVESSGPSSFFQLFGIPYLPGPILHRLGRFTREAPPELRSAWQTFFTGLCETGEMSTLASIVPRLFPIILHFGDSIGEVVGPSDEVVVDGVVETLRSYLEGSLVQSNVENLLNLVRLAARQRPFRKILMWMSRNVEAAYAYEDRSAPAKHATMSVNDLFLSKPWETMPGYDGTLAPPAPLFPGDAGPRVTHLHYVLQRIGVMPLEILNPENITTFGNPTSAALESFQVSHGLVEDGSCERGHYDATTRALILSIVESEQERSEI